MLKLIWKLPKVNVLYDIILLDLNDSTSYNSTGTSNIYPINIVSKCKICSLKYLLLAYRYISINTYNMYVIFD